MLRRVLLALALLSAPGPAVAAGRVLTAQDSTVFVSSARVVRAEPPTGSTQWLSLGLEGGPGRVVMVLPVAAGTRVDPSLDAFFAAIDGVTAPRIRPPKPVLACGATHEGSLENTSLAPQSGLDPSSVAVLDDIAQLSSFAIQQGVAFGAEDTALLSQAGGARFVAVVYDLTQDAGFSKPLRVQQPSTAALGVGLLATDAAPDVTVFTVAEGRASVPAGLIETAAGDLGIEWQVLSGTSSYLADRRTALLAKQGGLAVIEASGSTPLFGWTVLPSGAGALSPGVKTYFEKAKKETVGVSSADFCVAPIWDAIAAGKTGARLSRACAAGALVTVPDAPGASACNDQPGPGEIAAMALACGGADDIAFALAGMRADQVRITRHVTVAGVKSPVVASFGVGDGPAVSVLVTADSQNTSGCSSGNGGASGGTTGGAGYGGDGGYGGYGASTGYYDPEPADPAVDVDCGVQIVESCGSGGGTGSGDGDSCSGDSSSDDGDTCGGDSTGAGDEGDTCGGDSTSNGDGDTCSGDSSAGAEGDTCSGGDSGGGESCSSGSGSSGGDCSVPRRPRRLRISALFLLFAAIALPFRRAGRSRRPRR
ncbi:MAG: hypothetical protein HYZ29_25500 [Myxococcales bacterium]|nr:hypothetical protein [Myxococcales bacterium]